MRLLLALALLAGMLPALAGASHDGRWRWYKEHVRIEDHTSEALAGYVETVAHNWNAAAGGGVVLDYVRMSFKENCAGVTADDGMVKVCSFRKEDAPADVGSGLTYVWTKRTPDDRLKIEKAKVMLVANTWNQHSDQSGYWWHPLGCHEIGHALGLNHWTDEQTSCLGTQLQTPGSHDAQALHRLYGGNGGAVFDPPIFCCVGLHKYGEEPPEVALSERRSDDGPPTGHIHGDVRVFGKGKGVGARRAEVLVPVPGEAPRTAKHSTGAR